MLWKEPPQKTSHLHSPRLRRITSLTRKLFACLGVFFTFISPVFSQDRIVAISFGELDEFAARNSPEVKVIEQTYNLDVTEGKIDLQWSNPVINYSQEFVEDSSSEQREHFLTLSKQFEMPWVYSLRRQSWDFQLKAASYQKEQKLKNFISEIKSGYVEIKLMEEQAERLKGLSKVITDTAEVAKSQLEEGAISGIEQNLIQLTLSNLDSRLLRLEQERRSLVSEWKIRIGVEETDDVLLLTEVGFKPVPIQSADAYVSMIPSTPGFLQRERRIDAAEKRVNMERSSLFPHFNLFGGYKRVDPDFNGFIVGVSLPLPLLNFNKPQVEKQQSELILSKNDLFYYNSRLQNQIKTGLMTIEGYSASLKKTTPQFHSTQDLIDKTVFSYKEGQISLTDLLNSIQIYSESVEQYYEQLTNYYRSIFQLEAMIDEQLVTF